MAATLTDWLRNLRGRLWLHGVLNQPRHQALRVLPLSPLGLAAHAGDTELTVELEMGFEIVL